MNYNRKSFIVQGTRQSFNIRCKKNNLLRETYLVVKIVNIYLGKNLTKNKINKSHQLIPGMDNTSYMLPLFVSMAHPFPK